MEKKIDVNSNFWVCLIVAMAILTIIALFCNGCGTVNGIAHDMRYISGVVEDNTASARK